MSKLYYVYAYLREDGTPYYVGKGSGHRKYAKHVGVSVPKDKKRIVVLHENLNEEEAHTLEVELIAHYGRKCDGTGILRNLTTGGEGSSGHKFIPSEDWKQARSRYMRSESNPMKNPEIAARFVGDANPAKRPDVRAKLSGDNNPSKRSEVRAKISAALSGVEKPYMRAENNPMRCKNIAAKLSGDNHFCKQPGYQWPTLTCAHCGIVVSVGMHNRWHGDRCKHKQNTQST